MVHVNNPPAPQGFFSTPVSSTVWGFGTTYTWTNMPAALTLFGGATGGRGVLQLLDLSRFKQARLVAWMSVAGASGSKLVVRYNTGTTPVGLGSYSAIGVGGSEVEVAIDATDVTYGAWTDIADAAKTNVFVGACGVGGDGSTDPQFIMAFMQFR